MARWAILPQSLSRRFHPSSCGCNLKLVPLSNAQSQHYKSDRDDTLPTSDLLSHYTLLPLQSGLQYGAKFRTLAAANPLLRCHLFPHAVEFAICCRMPYCLLFVAACRTVCYLLPHAVLFATCCCMLCCLLFVTVCYTVCYLLPHAILFAICCHMPCCLLFMPHAVLFAMHFRMSCCLLFVSQAMLFAIRCCMLYCLLFLPHATYAHAACYALLHGMLFAIFATHRVVCYFVTSRAVCYALLHAVLFDIFVTSRTVCYALPHAVLFAMHRHMPYCMFLLLHAVFCAKYHKVAICCAIWYSLPFEATSSYCNPYPLIQLRAISTYTRHCCVQHSSTH